MASNLIRSTQQTVFHILHHQEELWCVFIYILIFQEDTQSVLLKYPVRTAQ